MANERDEKGHFIKGHTGNPTGRAPREREERYYAILMQTVTFADWERIIQKAVEHAKKGDTAARKFLADYLIGPPVERKEFTGKDGEPIQFIEIIKDAGNDKLPDDQG